MYSRRIVKANIERYEKLTRQKLVRYKPAACFKMVDHLNSLYDFENDCLRKDLRPQGLLPSERAFIRNEITLSRLDFSYWCSRYAKIKHWQGGHLVPFVFNAAQKITLAYWSQLEEKGLAIAIQSLKARQLGISTITEMAVAHRVQFKPHINAIVGSSDPDKSKLMAHMMETCWDEQPWWMVPQMTARRAGILIEYGRQNSAVSIQHGTQFTGIGRGTTTNTCHLSECVEYANPDDLIDASLMGAAHESPELFLVLESTAKGRNNWWHRTWRNNKEGWPRTLLKPVFLPWYVGRDLYPTETEMRRNPIPLDWRPKSGTINHAEKAKVYVHADPILRRYLGADWTMPREQMWWWECKREEAIKKKQLPQFLSEYPSDDEEAFQSTNVSAFDGEIVIDTRNRAMAQPPTGVYSITGDVVSPRLYPDKRDINQSAPSVHIRAHWESSVPSIDFELIPLNFESYSEDPNSRLYIWEHPKPNCSYAIGVDTSDGIGQDRSIIQVLRLRDPYDPESYDTQCAEFASAYVNSRDLWPLCLAIGTYYSVPVNGQVEQIRQVIECNGNGESVQYELRKLGWWHFHPWQHYDNKRVHASSTKIGWYTNVRTRSMSVDTIVTAVRDEWLIINSPWFCEEMSDFERDEYRQSLKAGYGGHDDRIMAMAFVLFSSYVNEITTDGRSFFTMRKRGQSPDGQPHIEAITSAELTNQILKEMGSRRDIYSQKYNPY